VNYQNGLAVIGVNYFEKAYNLIDKEKNNARLASCTKIDLIYVLSVIYVFCKSGTLTISMLIDMAGFIPQSFILCAGYYFYNKNR
jgi:hypothetical protein